MNLWKASTITLAISLVCVVGTGAINSAAAERQPHMKTSLKHLEKAKHVLEKAAPDKGGHRVKAIEFVDSAIAEVKAGVEFDNKH